MCPLLPLGIKPLLAATYWPSVVSFTMGRETGSAWPIEALKADARQGTQPSSLAVTKAATDRVKGSRYSAADTRHTDQSQRPGTPDPGPRPLIVLPAAAAPGRSPLGNPSSG